MEALEECGIAGKNHLVESLSRSKDPIKTIEVFQNSNKILLPTLTPALHLLDMHNKKRLDFHESLQEVLKNRLIEEINEITRNNEPNSKERLLDVLEKSFCLVKVESLSSVSMCLLKNLKKVPEKYLTTLTNDKELYKICPIEVKRQIWQKNQTLFGDEVLPLLHIYIKDKESAFLEHGNAVFDVPPKQRRQCKALKDLTEVIGKNIRLYDMVLQFLRTFYLKTSLVHYCTLRTEILMSLHDDELTDVCQVDPCYKFTWCLNACMKENYVDTKQARELQGFLDNISKKSEKVIGDLSMILCDPFAMNTILCSIIKTIHDVTVKESLPRDNGDFHLLIRMLALGHSAWEIIDKQIFKEPIIDKEITQTFIPSLITHYLIDKINQLKVRSKNLQKTEEEKEKEEKLEESKVAVSPPPKKRARKAAGKNKKEEEVKTPLDRVMESVAKCYSSDHLCKNVLIWYTLDLIKQKKKSLLIDILQVLVKSSKDITSNFLYVSMLAYNFTQHSEVLADEVIFQLVFYKLFTPVKTLKDLQQRAIMQLLLHTCHRGPYDKVKRLCAKMEPNAKAGEALRELYRSLKEKVTALEQPATTTSENNHNKSSAVPMLKSL